MRKFRNLQFIHTIFGHFRLIFTLFRLRVGWHPVYRQNRTFPFCPQNEHPDPQKSFDSKRKSPQHRCCGLDWRRWGNAIHVHNALYSLRWQYYITESLICQLFFIQTFAIAFIFKNLLSLFIAAFQHKRFVGTKITPHFDDLNNNSRN